MEHVTRRMIEGEPGGVEKVASAVPGARCVVPNYNVQRFPLSKHKQRGKCAPVVAEMQAAGSHLATASQYLSILSTGKRYYRPGRSHACHAILSKMDNVEFVE